MNKLQPFVRKIIYVGLIVVLLFPLSMLSKPATLEDPGGWLAQQRQEHGLSQANIGEIDARGESIKLAMFGMRGLAANILWTQAIEYKKKKDWSNLRLTLDKISKLQPNFISVWSFQAWNLSYNVSAEFDDYRDRYFWVKEGIKFMEGGIKYNEKEARLLGEIGRMTGQKIGRADEWKQFRLLFADPDDDLYDYLNASLPVELRDPLERRDNWLMGKWYYRSAERLLDREGKTIKGETPHIFHSHPVMWQFNYAKGLETDGTFGEVARAEWGTAGREWEEYGRMPFAVGLGETVRLNDYEALTEKVEKLVAELDALAPELRAQIRQEKLAKLTPEQRTALDTPLVERDEEQHMLAYDAAELARVTHREVAARIQGDDRRRATEIAAEAMDAQVRANTISRLRGIVNFENWRLRAEVEQSDEALEARELLFSADEEILDLERKRALYEEGFTLWGEVLEKYPGIAEDSESGDDMVEHVNQYRTVLSRLDQPFPEDFILQELVDRFGDE